MKHAFLLVLFTALIMLGLPWLAVTFVQCDASMAVCFLLFFAVDPIYAVAAGIFAGRNIKAYWYQPIRTSVLFLVGTWLLFDFGDPAFLSYAGIYLLLGLTAMVATWLITKPLT